mmetsp:Transcript_58214/g.155659  ORF Transcript_58214/g.155659 Transcript_58214/m.155659 type:complete len:240 (-) Transcript_58214:862-1581(-)
MGPAEGWPSVGWRVHGRAVHLLLRRDQGLAEIPGVGLDAVRHRCGAPAAVRAQAGRVRPPQAVPLERHPQVLWLHRAVHRRLRHVRYLRPGSVQGRPGVDDLGAGCHGLGLFVHLGLADHLGVDMLPDHLGGHLAGLDGSPDRWGLHDVFCRRGRRRRGRRVLRLLQGLRGGRARRRRGLRGRGGLLRALRRGGHRGGGVLRAVLLGRPHATSHAWLLLQRGRLRVRRLRLRVRRRAGL